MEVRAVTMVTPVANMASDARNSAIEKPGIWALVAWMEVEMTFGIKMFGAKRILPQRCMLRFVRLA